MSKSSLSVLALNVASRAKVIMISEATHPERSAAYLDESHSLPTLTQHSVLRPVSTIFDIFT